MLLLAIAGVLVGLLTLAELRWPARREAAPRMLNLGVWAARLMLQFTAVPAVGLLAATAARRMGLAPGGTAGWPFVAGALAFVLAMDLGEYLYHRAQHAIPWLWRRHALHHSDPCMNATTTERHWWGDMVLKSLLFGAPLAVLLQPTQAVYGLYCGLSLWNYVSHANVRLDFGRWSFLLNSPAYHRLHHARAPEHYGANFAALFPVFDVLAGSYRRPVGFVQTGLDEAPATLRQALAWPPTKDQRVAVSPA